MNLKCTNKPQDGSALLVALGLTLVLSIALASYLSLTLNERALGTRSGDWNAAIPVAEAGVEEALTHLYYYGTNNLATNGYWTLGTDGMYHKSRTLASGTYYTAIQMGTYPTIWSTGRVTAPFGGTNAIIKRLVKVTVSKAANFGGGITAKGTISMSGGAYLDSFASVNGPYSSSIATSNAVALSDSTVAGAINMSGGAGIAGNAITGPGGTVTTSGGATVTGTTSANANVQINDIPTPTLNPVSIALPGSATFGGTNYTYAFTNGGNYQLGALALSGGQNMVINGNVVIYFTSTADFSGSSYLYIAPNSSLTIYIAGKLTISGSGVVNGGQNAASCLIYGLPGCNEIDYSGSANFIGVVDAPDALFNFSGNESASGSFIVGSTTISGQGGVHYDTSLSASQQFLVQSWNELPAP